MSTRRLRQHKAARVFGFKAVDGAPDGTFEAIVSVFGNVDFGGDQVVAGAFKSSLERWAASGDPIPVIFSHQWDNLDAHVGVVLEAEELLAGDSRLPAELADFGGLFVKGALELDEPFAARLWAKMKARAIREFSFAYDVLKARPGTEGATLDLLELDLIEVGPTLKGMNPATELISAKSESGPLEALEAADALGLDEEDETPDDELDDDEVDEPEADLEEDTAGAKASAPIVFAGSLEESLGAIRASAEVWAAVEYGSDLYWLHVEATFPAESRVIVCAERWEDPLGEGPLWELNYSTADDGTVTIEDATELELEVSVTARPKALERDLKRLAGLGRKLAGIAGTPSPSEGKAEEREGAKAEDRKTSDNGPSPAVAAAQAATLALV